MTGENKITGMRESIPPTYDSRETGPRYHVTYMLDHHTVTFQEPIADPFVRATLHVSWRDRLRSLLRRDMAVTVIVGGHPDVVNDVLELDADTLVAGSSRRLEFNALLGDALGRFAGGES